MHQQLISVLLYVTYSAKLLSSSHLGFVIFTPTPHITPATAPGPRSLAPSLARSGGDGAGAGAGRQTEVLATAVHSFIIALFLFLFFFISIDFPIFVCGRVGVSGLFLTHT